MKTTTEESASAAGSTVSTDVVPTEVTPTPAVAAPTSEGTSKTPDNPKKPIDPRPRIVITGQDRPLSKAAQDVGQVLASRGIYLYANEPSLYEPADGTLVPVKPAKFRTWVEKYIICLKGSKEATEVKTMSSGDAGGILLSPQFRDELRVVDRIHSVCLPVMRADAKVDLLKPGYDRDARILTAETEDPYKTDMPLEDAQKFLRELLVDFPFADDTRSLGASIAAMVTVYGLSLLPPKTIVPAFQFRGNQPGLGKGLLAQLAIIPVLGYAPTGVAPKDETETRKLLFATAREGRPIVLLDNVTGRLASPSLESFITTSTVTGRVVGTSMTLNCKKQSVVFITGHGLTMNADMGRRTLIVDLFLDEPPGDRIIGEHLDENCLLAMRSQILAALYALVREWDRAKQPPPSVINPNFAVWSKIIGGIVERAGFGCVCQAAMATTPADSRQEDMNRLVALMFGHHLTEAVTFARLVQIARENRLFSEILKSEVGNTTKGESTALGRLFTANAERFFPGKLQFTMIGTGHARRYALRRPLEASDAEAA